MIGILCTLLLGSFVLAAEDPGAKLKQEFEAAKTFLVAGDLAQAEARYRHAISLGLRQLAGLSVSEDSPVDATQLLETALQAAPDDLEAQVDLAVVWFRRGQLDKAKSGVQSVLAREPNLVRAQNLLGRIEFLEGDVSGAIRDFRASLAAENDFETAYYLSLAYLKAKNPSEASVLFSEMLASMGPSAALYVMIGRAYTLSGYPEPAISALRGAIRLDTQYPGAHLLLGNSYLQQFGEQAYPQARAAFEEELKLRPDDYTSLLLLGIVAVNQRDFRAALEPLLHAARLRPDGAQPYLFIGEIYSATGRPQDAVSALEKYIALAGTDPEEIHDLSRANFLLGQALLRLGREAEGKKSLVRSQELREAKFRYDQEHLFEEKKQASTGESRTSERITELLQAHARDQKEGVRGMVKEDFPAVSAATKSAVRSPGTKAAQEYRKFVAEILASSYNDLGVMRAKGNRFAEAAELFRQAARWNLGLGGLDRNWGLAAYRAERYAEAIPPLARELAAHPDDAFIRRLLGLSYFITEDYAKTVEVLGPFASSPPDDPGLLFAWGTALVRTRDPGRAAPIFRRLLEQNARNPQVHLLLGQAYAQQEDYPSALAELRRALQLDPRLAEAHYYSGLALLHQSDFDGAAQEFRAELELRPGGPVTTYHLGFALLSKGETQPAIALFREVVKAKPDYELAHLELGRALLQTGDLPGAIESLETAKKLAPDRDATWYLLSQAYRQAGRPQDAAAALATYQKMIETSRLKKRESLETEKP